MNKALILLFICVCVFVCFLLFPSLKPAAGAALRVAY